VVLDLEEAAVEAAFFISLTLAIPREGAGQLRGGGARAVARSGSRPSAEVVLDLQEAAVEAAFFISLTLAIPREGAGQLREGGVRAVARSGSRPSADRRRQVFSGVFPAPSCRRRSAPRQ